MLSCCTLTPRVRIHSFLLFTLRFHQSGDAPIHLSALYSQYPDQLECVRVLVALGAEIDAQDGVSDQRTGRPDFLGGRNICRQPKGFLWLLIRPHLKGIRPV